MHRRGESADEKERREPNLGAWAIWESSRKKEGKQEQGDPVQGSSPSKAEEEAPRRPSGRTRRRNRAGDGGGQ